MTDEEPIEAGWYAVVRCWDPEEGGIPGAAYWDRKWDNPYPIVSRSKQSFKSRGDAESWAYTNDIGW